MRACKCARGCMPTLPSPPATMTTSLAELITGRVMVMRSGGGLGELDTDTTQRSCTACACRCGCVCVYAYAHMSEQMVLEHLHMEQAPEQEHPPPLPGQEKQNRWHHWGLPLVCSRHRMRCLLVGSTPGKCTHTRARTHAQAHGCVLMPCQSHLVVCKCRHARIHKLTRPRPCPGMDARKRACVQRTTHQGRVVREQGGNVPVRPQTQQDEVAHRQALVVAGEHGGGQANHAPLVVGGRLAHARSK